jgi:toxin secretion/phage lysis holin
MRWEEFTKTFATVCGAIAGFFGGWSDLLTLMCLMMLLDYLTGLLVALRGKSPKSECGGISSKAGLDGFLKKVFMFIIVVLANTIDKVTGANIFQTATICFFIANEGISIIENAQLMDVKIPEGLMNAIDFMRKKSNDATNADDDGPDDTKGE